MPAASPRASASMIMRPMPCSAPINSPTITPVSHEEAFAGQRTCSGRWAPTQGRRPNPPCLPSAAVAPKAAADAATHTNSRRLISKTMIWRQQSRGTADQKPAGRKSLLLLFLFLLAPALLLGVEEGGENLADGALADV